MPEVRKRKRGRPAGRGTRYVTQDQHGTIIEYRLPEFKVQRSRSHSADRSDSQKTSPDQPDPRNASRRFAGTSDQLLAHIKRDPLKDVIIALANGCPALDMTKFKDGAAPQWWPDQEQALLAHARATAGLPGDFYRVLYNARHKFSAADFEILEQLLGPAPKRSSKKGSKGATQLSAAQAQPADGQAASGSTSTSRHT